MDSYNGRLVGTRMRSVECCHFNDRGSGGKLEFPGNVRLSHLLMIVYISRSVFIAFIQTKFNVVPKNAALYHHEFES